MFTELFFELRRIGVPVSLNEYLTLMEVMERGIPEYSVDNFYYVSRATLVKDERHLDRFDQVFSHVFKGLEAPEGQIIQDIPEDWLKKLTEKYLTEEEKAKIESLGGWEELMETLKKRMAEQEKRHQGGSKWIGTAGTSPFGAYGYNPEGIRIGQEESRHRRAVKVWDKREFRNLDDKIELGTRNIKLALRRLRQFAREGVPTELDLTGTIKATANNGGFLDLKMYAERKNTVKILLFFDIGGSMDDHVKVCEELFSATRTEFKNLEFFYFHNCPYESVWKDNRRRHNERLDLWEVLNTYPPDYKVIFVGDASMSPYEITYAGGSVEHWNEEAGAVWLQRILETYKHAIWLNPQPARTWSHTPSIELLSQLMEDRMYPLTLDGLDKGMRELTH
ncbi:MAG: VWA domain-containing protein [Alphaproteobacteria bacterium]|nr:VWA domain-containing protein [Alphaproteobacteria bacterium]